jgi:hypothetical protein
LAEIDACEPQYDAKFRAQQFVNGGSKPSA